MNGDTWRHYSDSDLAGNSEPGNKRRSQMGYVSVFGDAPIGWASKVSSVMFDSASESMPSRGRSQHPCNTPTCHSGMSDLHADVSSGAAESRGPLVAQLDGHGAAAAHQIAHVESPCAERCRADLSQRPI